MPHHVCPIVEVRCFPRTAIPQRGSQFFSADTLGDLVFASSGAGGLIDGATTAGVSWVDQWQFTQLSGVDFIRFGKDKSVQFGNSQTVDKGDVRDVAGFVLGGRVAKLDLQIGDNAGELSGGHTEQNWTALEGTWQTVLPPHAEAPTAILNTGSEAVARAESVGTVTANRSFWVDVKFAAHDPSGARPLYSYFWGTVGEGQYSISAEDGGRWAILQRRGGQMVIVDDFPIVARMNGGHYIIGIRRYAGRLVVTFNDGRTGTSQSFWVVDKTLPASGGAERRPKAKEINWGSGKMAVGCINVKARTAVWHWKFSEPNGTPFTGTIARHLNRTSYLPEDATFIVKTSPAPRAGTGLTATATVEPNAVDYSLFLTASTDGLDTPLVDNVLIRRAPDYTAPSQSYLDIWAAVKSITIRKAMPPSVCGDEFSIEVDRDVLDLLSGSWTTYVQDFCPVTIRVCWQNDDLTTTDWEIPVRGFIHGLNKRTLGQGQRSMTIRGRDNLVRLQKPAALIDHHTPPLDFWFATMFELLPGQIEPNGKFYAAHGVQEIVRMFLGDTEAGALNGNGNALRYLPNGHPPLLTTLDDCVGWYELNAIAGAANGYQTPPPMRGGFYFPPPWREDAWFWINKLAKEDQCVCYRGWADNDSTVAPSLLYGRPLSIIANRTAHRITDDNYISGDLNKLILDAETETRPERDINRILAYSKPLSGGLEALAPALSYAEARLEGWHPNSEVYSWMRSLLVSDDIAALPGVAQILADQILSQLTGVERIWATLTVRGEAAYQFGDVATVTMSGVGGDTNLGLNGNTYKVEPVTHIITKTDKGTDFKTQLGLRPLSTAEAAAL